MMNQIKHTFYIYITEQYPLSQTKNQFQSWKNQWRPIYETMTTWNITPKISTPQVRGFYLFESASCNTFASVLNRIYG
jgi:hypothetical protein